MPEYIERETIKEYLKRVIFGADQKLDKLVDDMPASDVRPIVLCKECDLSYETFGGLSCAYWVCVDCAVPEDFFCAHGQKREAAK